jgi:hypothetical protein
VSKTVGEPDSFHSEPAEGTGVHGQKSPRRQLARLQFPPRRAAISGAATHAPRFAGIFCATAQAAAPNIQEMKKAVQFSRVRAATIAGSHTNSV